MNKEKNNTCNHYSSNLPYPEIRVMGPNKYYASLLKEDYVGLVSEMTAITQYLYHHFVTKEIDNEISNMLREISIVEMHHLDILAELIFLLGEQPIYYTQNSYWNGSYVYYGNNLYEQLIADLDAEYKAIENYQRHIEMIHDPYIQAILKRIIIDEEMHIKLFTSAINKLKNCGC